MPDCNRILVIDDHPMFRDALRVAVGKAFPDAQFEEGRNIDEALVALERHSTFDLALLDLKIPGVQGFDGLLRLRKLYPRLPVLVISGLEDNSVISKVLSFGAAGFVPKSVGRESLEAAIKTVLDGSVYIPDSYTPASPDEAHDIDNELIKKISSLTPQQFRVLQMLRKGLLNKQIAEEMNVGARTIKAHVSEILRKLDVHSRTQAVIEASKVDDNRFTKEETI